jgi:L-iduronidase
MFFFSELYNLANCIISAVSMNLALIGSLPARSVVQVRIHWLMNLVSITSVNPLQLEFSFLDQLVHFLWSHDLRPGFEVMGNPSSHFTDFKDLNQGRNSLMFKGC